MIAEPAEPHRHPDSSSRKRTRSGCLTCRERKVKCDEQQPVCRKCQIKVRPCVWPSKGGGKEGNGGSSTGKEWTRPTTKKRIYVPPAFLPANADDLATASRRIVKPQSQWLLPSQRVELMLDPTFLRPYFPNLDDCLIMRHYLKNTVEISIAFSSPSNPWNPFVSVLAPLALDHLPGVSPASDALRTSMLAVGAVHLRYLHNPLDQAGAQQIMATAQPKVLSLIKEALELPDGRARPVGQDILERVLGALLVCMIACILAADNSWHLLMKTALDLIERLGGAEKMLSDCTEARFSPYRFVLEQFAVRDVFGCLTTEQGPSLLNHDFTPWFFSVENLSSTDAEWESVERMFGISRGMVDFVARTCKVLSKLRQIGSMEPETRESSPSEDSEMDARDESALQAVDQSVVSEAPSPEPITCDLKTSSRDDARAAIQDHAESLMAELEVWDAATNFVPLHYRTQYGNHAHRHAMRIRLLTEVFGVESSDSRVKGAVAAIMELGKELLARNERIVWLTWPILVASFHLTKDDSARKTVTALLSEFSPHACFDNRAAGRMVEEYWKQHDETGVRLREWRAEWFKGTKLLFLD